VGDFREETCGSVPDSTTLLFQQAEQGDLSQPVCSIPGSDCHLSRACVLVLLISAVSGGVLTAASIAFHARLLIRIVPTEGELKPMLYGNGSLVGLLPVTSEPEPCMDKWKSLGDWGAEEEGSTWQIVFPGFMNVRSAKLYQSRAIGMKASCMMVYGKREDNWVRLLYEPGYMMISLNGTTLMEESLVSYRLIPEGTCEGAGRHAIADANTCRAAAIALGLAQSEVKVLHGSGQPQGCFLQGISVLLATNPTNKGNGADGARKLLCSSHATPRADPCHSEVAGKRPGPLTVRQTEGGVSFFCFAVARTTGYEPELLKAQVLNRAGVFSCDDSAVLTMGGSIRLTPGWNTTEIPEPEAEPSVTARKLLSGRWLSPDIFRRAWHTVIRDPRAQASDWVVKVDTGTVFFPERLRTGLHLQATPEAQGHFLPNCEREQGGPVFRGAVEALSRAAVKSYVRSEDRCEQELLKESLANYSFMHMCLDMLNVTLVLDKQMVTDARCQPAPCTHLSKVAFHGYTNTSSYLQCWEEATEVSLTAQLMETAT